MIKLKGEWSEIVNGEIMGKWLRMDAINHTAKVSPI